MEASAQIGKRYAATHYAVGREKIREYAHAVGETAAVHLDLAAARAAGHVDLVAPPMFAVVFQGQAIIPALFDPELEIDFAMLVHGGQELRWPGPLIVAGDELRTEVEVEDISERVGMRFYVFAASSVNQRGDLVCTGRWQNIVRGRE